MPPKGQSKQVARPALAPIELERKKNIERNRQVLRELGFDEKPKPMVKPTPLTPPTSPPSQSRRRDSMEPSRRSRRLEGKEAPKYNMDRIFALEELTLRSRRRNSSLGRHLDEAEMTPEEVEELRQKWLSFEEENDGDESYTPSSKRSGAIDSGKGRRVINGRVYDSRNGVTCHWCRQKTVEEKVTCTNENCRGGNNLRVSYCRKCLKNRNGENIYQAINSGCWICPCCRVSCGPGCISCCNCSFCRVNHGVSCTGQILGKAKRAGFDNVHDYLIHLTTGETPEVIAARKSQYEWGQFLQY
eukprot:TRINITY_DN2879_c1_g2_i1.p1 TRINITY_DN2879_c1_g2~~TRINITY_DN2879_c1_g2_i1.p1  ORF type:complete len:321 (-),score=33.00 TRINITY_DN2879_c1_g2_i1:2776-3678(-)